MSHQGVKQINSIEPTSRLWHKLFVDIGLPMDGTVVEVAPGYEPKIGNALALNNFQGTIWLIEPDQQAACHIRETYRKILPQATVHSVVKSLQAVEVGVDVPQGVDALVASHAFDDMVIAFLVGDKDFFSQEKEDRTHAAPSIKKAYIALKNKDYEYGVEATVAAWKRFVKRAQPHWFIASQYPSHTLIAKGLTKRQNSGFSVLRKLQTAYKISLIERHYERPFGFKGNPRWWIVAKDPWAHLDQILRCPPASIYRLNRSIFVPQYAQKLSPKDYSIVYCDSQYFGKGVWEAKEKAHEFALSLNNKKTAQAVMTYADRQKDYTNIGLNGNLGSGRAVYYGERFNILGVGKTSLCTSTVPSHSTGRLDLISAMRRVIISRWVNYFTQRAPVHLALIVLKKTEMRKWSSYPIPLALLVRLDDGCLDRPSHIEQCPEILIHFEETIKEYAQLDAEYFAYRFMLGAWSTSNYSLAGHIIDLESVSFTKYRGPYYTSSKKYPHNRFGYERLGFLKLLHQLARVKGIHGSEIEKKFFRERREHLGRCLLSLLGIDNHLATIFFSKHKKRVTRLSGQFERLSKKINNTRADLNLYVPIPDGEEPSLLDASCLLKNLAHLYRPRADAEQRAFRCIVRETALACVMPDTMNVPAHQCKSYLQNQALITSHQLKRFLCETKMFVHDLFQMLALLEQEQCLPEKKYWNKRLHAMNQSFPTMFELNKVLKSLAEAYRSGNASPKLLGVEINKLCELPNHLKSVVEKSDTIS